MEITGQKRTNLPLPDWKSLREVFEIRDGRLARIGSRAIRNQSVKIGGVFYNAARIAFMIQYMYDPGPLCVVAVDGDKSNLDAVNLVAVLKPQAMKIHEARNKEIRKRCRSTVR